MRKALSLLLLLRALLCYRVIRDHSTAQHLTMDLVNFITRSQIGIQKKNLNLDFAIEKLSLTHESVFEDLQQEGAPPMACALRNNVLAVVNESGELSIFNKNNLAMEKSWKAHHNAIFDVRWRNDNEVATSSGDQSIVLWDVESRNAIYKFERAHKGSIKSIDFEDANIFASGARDGIIKIWDLRCSYGGAVALIEEAHLSRLPALKLSPKSKPQRSSPLNSVTCVIFHPLTRQLYSGGANDATIKIWDLRKCRRAKVANGQSTPIRQLAYSGRTSYTSAHGFSSLVFDNQCRLYASCSDHSVYRYSGAGFNEVIKFTGHKFNNYTRIKTMNNYLISGSADAVACIWPIACSNNLQTRSVVLPVCILPHEDEVTAVECDNSWMSIYTCSDDQRIAKWSVYNKSETERKAEKFKRTINVKDMSTETTQSKSSSSSSSITPFTTITNWLNNSTSRHSAPSAQSFFTPKIEKSLKRSATSSAKNSNKKAKENSCKRSKRRLFCNNKKISDYFN